MTEILKANDKKEREESFLRKSKLAIALVQGSWDKNSYTMLKENFLPLPEDDDPSSFERGLRGAAFLFFGEGSIARAIVGKPVKLPERDRGLIIINDIAGVAIEIRHDWEVSAILASAIASGQKFNRISGALGGNIRWFAGFVADLVKGLDDSGKDVLGDEPKRLANKGDKMVEYLTGIYGGSYESLLKNRARLEQNVFTEAEKRIMRMDTKQLSNISDSLRTVTGSDPILDSSINSAREIFVEILKSNKSGINGVLDSLSRN